MVTINSTDSCVIPWLRNLPDAPAGLVTEAGFCSQGLGLRVFRGLDMVCGSGSGFQEF